LAQERDLFKNIVKESIKMDFILNPTTISPDIHRNDSTLELIEVNVNKNPLPILGYNYRQNSLFLHYKDSLPVERKWEISPHLLAGYTPKEDSEEDDSSIAAANASYTVLTPVASVVMANPIAFFTYLMRMGVLSDEPFVHVGTKKEKKKRDALRTIQEVYAAPDEEK
jgi:hypothetical protein